MGTVLYFAIIVRCGSKQPLPFRISGENRIAIWYEFSLRHADGAT